MRNDGDDMRLLDGFERPDGYWFMADVALLLLIVYVDFDIGSSCSRDGGCGRLRRGWA